MAQWADFPWGERLFASADESVLSHAMAAVENAYANEGGGHSRFPGMLPFATFPTMSSRTYLTTWRDNLIAATDRGSVFRISREGKVENVTGVPISGGKRVVFSSTEDQLVMAAGGPILQLSRDRTEVLSSKAPNSTHVVFLNGYLLAIEPGSGRFFYCDPGAYHTWNPLSAFSADAKADNLLAAAVTPYNELLLAGSQSIEQWELLANGTQPFARRWTTGEGVAYPYTLVADKTGTYGVNDRFEFVRFVAQVSQDQSADVGLVLETIDDWTDAWAQEISVKAQKMILLQMPAATNSYGSKGVTILLDYRNKKWAFLFGWDDKTSSQARWPAWSLQRCWGRVFAGVAGGVALMDNDTYTLLGSTYPFVTRSGHVDKWGPCRIDELRIRLKRGVGANGAVEPVVGLRVNRDNEGFDQVQFETMGTEGERDMTIRFGGQGCANTWQFEIRVTDDVPMEFVRMQVLVERLGW